jgi:hypothetical protein
MFLWIYYKVDMDKSLSKNKLDMAIIAKGFSVNRMLIFQPSHGENKLHFDETMMMSAQMDFYSASSVTQQSMGRHRSTRTHYPNSETTSLCSYLIMLITEWRNSKYQLYSLWFDMTGPWTHDLPHSRWTPWTWHHQCGFLYWIRRKYNTCPEYITSHILSQTWIAGLLWPWSYGSCIYNYLCNQCLSPLMLWVRILVRARCTTLCDKVCQWLATGQWFSLVSSTATI